MKKYQLINEIKKITQSDREVDLTGFQTQKKLNPRIWDGDILQPEIRKNLLKIADDYFESLELPGVDIEDVTFTGSLANYNWSKYSDVDLHIVVNYGQFPDNTKELYVEFFDLKKVVFNDRHDIKIFGYDVECFVQDEVETTFSSGIYSLYYDMWVNEPKKISTKNVDLDLVKEKSEQWMRVIDGVVDNLKDETPDTIKSLVKKYKQKLKKFRNCGLEKGGELSVENLVFKLLRRNGYISKLYDIPTEVVDKKLSMNQ
jgi:predicted nucleotidyltransferase